jgi:SprT-like family
VYTTTIRPVPPQVHDAHLLALELMVAHGLGHWGFRFNNHRRNLGLCIPPRDGQPGRIEISIFFACANPIEEVRDTLLHEIAHALVGTGNGHNSVWRRKAREIGARPNRCGQAEMPAGRWKATCGGCGKVFNRFRRPKRVDGWHCKGCGQHRGNLVWACE